MRRVLVTLGVTAFAAGMFAASAQAAPSSISKTIHKSAPVTAAGLLPVHVTLPGKQFGPPRPNQVAPAKKNVDGG